MVWGVIVYNTRSPLVLIRGTMTAQGDRVVTRLSLHCCYPTLACPIPRFVSNRAYLGHLERRIGHPTSLNELEARLQQIWNEMSQDIIQNLYASMPDRIASCIRAGDGSTGDEAHFWLNGYVNKQNCRIWSEANPQELWFQQDGATCHTARATINLLKDTFGDRLISCFGPVNWPPRSCDLTPLDYFLWGYVKSLVYADKPQTLDHLEDNIRRVIADIRPQMLEKVIENWTSRSD
ncbi:DUF4817 domain-containing protein [Trichonephila clavipes]|nr:DUF4817 domain-containing protein [Trichonephila clavipes]